MVNIKEGVIYLDDKKVGVVNEGRLQTSTATAMVPNEIKVSHVCATSPGFVVAADQFARDNEAMQQEMMIVLGVPLRMLGGSGP